MKLSRQELLERVLAANNYSKNKNSSYLNVKGSNYQDDSINILQRKVRGDYEIENKSPEENPLIPAAVLVPLVKRNDEYNVILTQRSADLSKHAGQISFPGGRIESEDKTPTLAALRETEEEIGLKPDYVEVIGHLDIYEVRTGFVVFPIIGLVREGFQIKVDPNEVADVFEVPLSYILNPRNHHRQGRVFFGKMRYFYVLPFQGRYIWGATAGMLVNLCETLNYR